MATTSSSLIVVVMVPAVTVAELLDSEIEKVSLISGRMSPVAGSEKESSWAPAARSDPPVLVRVRVTAPLAAVEIAEEEMPAAGRRLPARRVAKSEDSLAESPLESRVMVRICPAPRPTPSRETA